MRRIALVLFVVSSLSASSAFAQIEGYGVTATGGAGGSVCTVTTSAESGAGSFESCVARGGNQTIQFAVASAKVGGTEYIQSNTTIDGCANGMNGITLDQTPDARRTVVLEGPVSNVVVRCIRFQGTGKRSTSDYEFDLLGIDGTGGLVSNVAVDRCTFVASTDGALDITGNVQDVTVQRSLFYATPLNQLIKYDTRQRISLHHNVSTSNGERNPQIKGDARNIDFVSNVIHNNTITTDEIGDSFFPYGTLLWNAASGSDSPGNITGNFVANAWVGQNAALDIEVENGSSAAGIYLSANYCNPGPCPSSPASSPLAVPAANVVTVTPPDQMRTSMLPGVGSPNRTAADQTRIDAVAAALPSASGSYTLTVAKAGTGSGTVTSAPSGINCGTDCSEAYGSGAVVTLTATAASGSTFAGWTGACIGTGSCVVTMSAARSVTATFDITPASYTLSVVKAGTGSGTVTSSPAGIDCGADCSEAYAPGTVVTLTATPAVGSSFSGWSGPCSGAGSCQVTVAAAQSVIATFTLNTINYTLSVAKVGTGSGTVTSSPAGINCGADCSEAYASGTVVTLGAVPATGSTFAGWTNGPCSGTGSCQVPMNGAQSVTATFNTNPVSYTLTVTKTGTGTGTVTSSPAGVSCGADCSESYLSGTVVTLTAAPASGSTFSGWSGGVCSGTGPCPVTMSAAKSVTATFTVIPTTYSLTVARSGDGSGTVTSAPAGVTCGADCSETYVSGTVVTLTPTPGGGSVFAGWSGACTGAGACQITMSNNRSVAASFALAVYSLTVTTTGSGSGTVSSSPAGISCGADCAEPYNRGTVVALSATADAGSSFGGWSGACTGSESCQVTMDAAKSVGASFLTAGAPPPVGDFDRDGRIDLLWRHQTTGSLYAWFLVGGKMTSGASLQPDRADRSWLVMGLGDLDRDTQTDLLWQNVKTGALTAWLMNGTKAVSGVAIPSIALPVPSTQSTGRQRRGVWQVRGLADFNRDGRDDVIWRHPQTGDLYAWFMNGMTPVSGTALSPSRFADIQWQLRGLADFNGDGQTDLVWHHQATGDIYVWLMNGTTAVGATYTNPSRFADTRWELVRVADLNSDGKADLLWHHQTSGDLYVWYMNGLVATTGGYLTPNRPSTPDWQVAPR